MALAPNSCGHVHCRCWLQHLQSAVTLQQVLDVHINPSTHCSAKPLSAYVKTEDGSSYQNRYMLRMSLLPAVDSCYHCSKVCSPICLSVSYSQWRSGWLKRWRSMKAKWNWIIYSCEQNLAQQNNFKLLCSSGCTVWSCS